MRKVLQAGRKSRMEPLVSASAPRPNFQPTMHLRTNAPQPGRTINYESIKASAFHQDGIVVVNLHDPRLTWVDREEAKRIGTKLYGQSKD